MRLGDKRNKKHDHRKIVTKRKKIIDNYNMNMIDGIDMFFIPKSPKFSILIPTKNRPEQIKSVIISACGTADYPNDIEFIFYLNDDDKLSIPVINEINSKYDIRYIQSASSSDMKISDTYNKLADIAKGDILMHCCDEVVFDTKSWDSLVTKKIDELPKDKIAYIGVYAGLNRKFRHGISPYGFHHKNWVKALGRLYPPYFTSGYGDMWINEISGSVGRKFIMGNITIWHRQVRDQTRKMVRYRYKRDNPLGLYNVLKEEREKDIQKLRKFIEEYK